jgi:5-methylthioadenosine/S-adenosylhomocysteine deaminase
MDLVVRGGTLVTQNARREIVRADLRVHNGRIAEIAPSIDARPCQLLDARGRFVIPGLVQSHVHLCQTLMRGLADDRALLEWLRERIWPLEGAHDPDSLYASARLGIAELLRGGTTAIQDMGTVHHTDVIFLALEETGLRAVAGKAMMDRQMGVPRGLRESPKGSRAATQASLKESVGLCERWNGASGGRIRYAFAPRFALSCTEGLLREVAVEARRLGARIHTHACENRDELAIVRAETGRGNVRYLHDVGLSGGDVGLAHCVWLEDDEADLLARTGTHVLHCPSSNLKLGSGIAPIPELLARGVSVSLGADGAPCNNNLDAFVEMRLAALVQAPRAGVGTFTAQHAFDLATVGGASALGLASEIGSLEVGKLADLVVLDLERTHALSAGEVVPRIVYSARATDVVDVLIGGRRVVSGGRIAVFDEDEVLAHARRELGRLLERAELRP